MSDSSRDESASPKPDVKDELNRLDIELKKIESWVKRVGLVLTLLTIWNAGGQSVLIWYQIAEHEEKQRLNVEMKMLPLEAPAGNGLFLSASLTNNSGRQINVLMLGVRIWKQEWVEGDEVLTKPELLIYSDSKVARCPPGICPARTDKTSLRNDDHPTVLATKETQTYTFGMYPVPPEELARGVWIEGFAYPVEQDEGTCVMTGAPPAAGTFPRVCNELVSGQGCPPTASCKLAASAPLLFRPADSK